jgi:hypothetical protein
MVLVHFRFFLTVDAGDSAGRVGIRMTPSLAGSFYPTAGQTETIVSETIIQVNEVRTKGVPGPTIM